MSYERVRRKATAHGRIPFRFHGLALLSSSFQFWFPTKRVLIKGVLEERVEPTMISSLLKCRAVASTRSAAYFSSKVVSIPIPQSLFDMGDAHPSKFDRGVEDLSRMSRTGEESIYKLGKHRSNAMELVHRVPITEVDGDMAICDGGGGALGHPLEYISLERPGEAAYCKYCSLRYIKKMK